VGKKTEKELTLTLVFRGETTGFSLDDIVNLMTVRLAFRSARLVSMLCPWAKTVRVKRYVARDLTLHPYPTKRRRRKEST